MFDTKLKIINQELSKLQTIKTLEQCQRIILSIIKLLDDTLDINDISKFKLFTDANGKISANASWFIRDAVILDRRATYKIHSDNNLNIDFKLYGLNKVDKKLISWVQALAPNFEDEPFNTSYNIGIDFIVPQTFDKIIIVLSNNWTLRTLELIEPLTATYQEIFSKWNSIQRFDNKKELHNILWDSFDIHPLNKKFYQGISERFNILRDHLVKKAILNEKYSAFFANRLLGRIIFCWFLDKKGIINKQLNYFDSSIYSDDTDYYKEKLEKLFFDSLNTPIDERNHPDRETPFLNGGLFEAKEHDLYNNNKLTFPKNYFDDLYGFLNSYNFTTDESTSQYQQVAIDPEMLGRIFENLLAEMKEETGKQARKAKGAFYTPKEIVEYMCKESLKEYLKTKLEDDELRDQRIYQLIDAPDKDFQDQDHNWRRDWKPYKNDILVALDDLKILDPACGSGAFPIGMMHLLTRVYDRLETRFDSYKTKLNIIEKNIFGVDIDPMAIEISRLRTWLSIIVDENSDSKKIKPLPNLEFKFVCANTLIPLDNSGEMALFDIKDLDKDLKILRNAYFNTESLNKKKKIKEDYLKILNITDNKKVQPTLAESRKTKQLRTYQPFDSENSTGFFDADFMFGIKEFNIIIGNPPYLSIRTGYFKEEWKNTYKNLYKNAKGQYDLYVLFIEKATTLLKDFGILSYIVPKRLLSNENFKNIREYILNNIPIKTYIDAQSPFDAANVEANIMIAQKNYKPDIINSYVYNISSRKLEYFTSINTDFIKIMPFRIFPFILKEDTLNILIKIQKKENKTLSDFLDINRGFECGYSDSSIVTYETKYPFLKSEDITSYIIKQKEELYCNPDFKNSAKYKKEEIFINTPKLLTKFVSSEIFFAIDNKGYCNTNSVYNCSLLNNELSIKYLLALLNSKFCTFWFNSTYLNSDDIFPHIQKNQLDSIPIKVISKKEQKFYIKLVDNIINNKQQNIGAHIYTQQIDEMVYKLYELTPEEIKIIEDTIKR